MLIKCEPVAIAVTSQYKILEVFIHQSVFAVSIPLSAEVHFSTINFEWCFKPSRFESVFISHMDVTKVGADKHAGEPKGTLLIQLNIS